MEIFGWSDDVVACVVAFESDPRLAFEGARNERPGGSMVLIGEGNVGDGALGF